MKRLICIKALAISTLILAAHYLCSALLRVYFWDAVFLLFFLKNVCGLLAVMVVLVNENQGKLTAIRPLGGAPFVLFRQNAV